MAIPVCGYKCNLFMETPPDYIKCGVCMNVLHNPQLTECCGRNVCHPCIKETISTDGPCPLAKCGKPHVKVSFNRKCRNDIDERRVCCSSRDNGCQWIDKLERLEKHLMECEFIEDVCIYCGVHVQRQHIEAHTTTCMQYPIECSQCGMTCERQYQSEHVTVCAFTQVSCPFSFVGCTSEVLNKDLPHHFSQCLPNHYALVEKLTHSLQIKAEKMERLVLQEYEEKTTQFKAEINELNAAISKACKQISVLQQAVHNREEEIRNLQKVQETASHNFASQIKVGMTEIEALKESIVQLRLNSRVKLYGPPIPRPRKFHSYPPEMSLATNPLIPPFAFTITDFVVKRRHNVVVLSPPFFTHRKGYKLILQVHCNGNERGKGKFISIYVYLLKGEHDSSLRWPFHGSITVEVRNLLNVEYYHSQTIIFDSRSDAGTRVEGDECFSQSKRLGYWNFMPFTALFPTLIDSVFPDTHDYQYIKNGNLKINVSKAVTKFHTAPHYQL